MWRLPWWPTVTAPSITPNWNTCLPWLPFYRAGSRAQAEPRVQGMDEAAVSTHAFNEDAFAGIKAAIDGLDWSPYAVKLAVMV